jgi:hypothetical protein
VVSADSATDAGSAMATSWSTDSSPFFKRFTGPFAFEEAFLGALGAIGQNGFLRCNEGAINASVGAIN